MPFIPFHQGPADALHGAIGVGCGVVGFMAYVTRAALNNMKMVSGWKAANQAAKERQLEAELKRAEAEEANRAKSEFLAVMTHELRTPLNAVIGYAELINEDLAAEGRTELADDATRITSSARHLLGLIDQILNMSSIDAGNEGLALRDVDVRKLLEEAVATLQDDARAAGNRISIRVSADAERAHTDGGKLAVSMAAIVSNAVKFTQNGLIAITAERDVIDGKDMLILGVSDTGIGIAPADMPRIFTAVHADRGRRHAHQGRHGPWPLYRAAHGQNAGRRYRRLQRVRLRLDVHAARPVADGQCSGRRRARRPDFFAL